MRSIALAGILILGAATAAMAQSSYRGDAAVTYHWVRTNATPGECGCFSLNGGGVSGSWDVRPGFAAVVEISAARARDVLSTGSSLTLSSYMGGVRFRVPQPWKRGAHTPGLFAQLLLGAAHAGGGVAGNADGSFAFASRIGGGLDVPVSSRFSIRMIQVDYYLTKFPNLTNDHQNNLMVGAGIVWRWSRKE